MVVAPPRLDLKLAASRAGSNFSPAPVRPWLSPHRGRVSGSFGSLCSDAAYSKCMSVHLHRFVHELTVRLEFWCRRAGSSGPRPLSAWLFSHPPFCMNSSSFQAFPHSDLIAASVAGPPLEGGPDSLRLRWQAWMLGCCWISKISKRTTSC